MSVKVWQHSNHLTRQHKKDKHDTGGDGVGLIRRMEKRKKKKERNKKKCYQREKSERTMGWWEIRVLCHRPRSNEKKQENNKKTYKRHDKQWWTLQSIHGLILEHRSKSINAAGDDEIKKTKRRGWSCRRATIRKEELCKTKTQECCCCVLPSIVLFTKELRGNKHCGYEFE